MNKLLIIIATLFVSMNTYSQEAPEQFTTDDGITYKVINNESEDGPGEVIVTRIDPSAGNVIIPEIVEYKSYYHDNDYNEIWYSFHYHPVEIADGAGQLRENVYSVTIPATVTAIGNYAFLGCKNLTSVSLSEGLISIGDAAFGSCAFDEIFLPNSLETIGEEAFSGNTSLKSISLPASIKEIPRMAFLQCENLTSVTLPSTLEIIGHQAFGFCGIKNIQLPQSLKEIKKFAFYNCEALESIYIPKNVSIIGDTEDWYYTEDDEEKIWKTTYGNPFRGCSSLKEIKVDNDNEFYDSREKCNAIIEKETNTLLSGCQTTTIPEDVPYLGGDSFAGMKNMTEIKLPQTITRIAPSGFEECEQLTEITIPSGMRILWYDVFRRCNSLKKVVIPEGIRVIEAGAFADCKNLETVTIPSTVKEIGPCAFSGYGYESSQMSQLDIKLKNIFCHVVHPFGIDEGVFTYRHATYQQWPYDRYDIYDNATLFVQAGSATEYKEADGWKRFKKIHELSDLVPTAIVDGQIPHGNVREGWYTIDGRKLNGEPSAHGLYIRDGRKVVR